MSDSILPTQPTQSPQAVSALDPTALSRLAKLYSVKAASLSTLTIPSTAQSLHNSILSYAILHETIAEEEGGRSKIVRAVCAHPFGVEKPDNYATSNPERRDIFTLQMVKTLDKMEDRSKCGIPHIAFGLGDAVISWPPPPKISVEVINAAQKKVDKSRVNASRFSLAFDSLVANRAAFDQQVKDTKNINRSLESVTSKASSILMTHYSVGEPTSERYSCSAIYSEVLLASTEGLPALYEFLQGVVLWKSALQEVPSADVKAFEMLRYVKDHGMSVWRSDGMKPSRTAASVVLQPGRMDDILNDAHDFFSSDTKKWYRAHGIPQRRSYLFYGPPGTGKTSTISVLASTLRLSCHFLQVSDSSFSNQDLADALRDVSKHALLVLEDVDTLFNEDRVNKSNSSMTFSGLLNTLDGLISAEGILTILTTNHADKIDAALLRGGRVDRSFLFEKPNREGIATYFRSFYKHADKAVVQKFVNVVCGRGEGDDVRNISTLQQLFISHRRSSAEECVEASDAFFDSYFERKRLASKSLAYHV